MTTELHIRKNLGYLPYLRKVVSRAAAALGMSRREIEETENVVAEIYTGAMDTASDSGDGNLCIRLSVHDECMLVEITDPSMVLEVVGDVCLVPECISRLTDDVELLGAEHGATIRIRRYAGSRKRESAKRACYLGALGTSSLQS